MAAALGLAAVPRRAPAEDSAPPARTPEEFTTSASRALVAIHDAIPEGVTVAALGFRVEPAGVVADVRCVSADGRTVDEFISRLRSNAAVADVLPKMASNAFDPHTRDGAGDEGAWTLQVTFRVKPEAAR
jgi:hypothetical protein